MCGLSAGSMPSNVFVAYIIKTVSQEIRFDPKHFLPSQSSITTQTMAFLQLIKDWFMQLIMSQTNPEEQLVSIADIWMEMF